MSATPDIPKVTAGSKTFTVNATHDAPLATGASTTCKANTATGLCTLRAAVEASDNNQGHVNTINLPAGTYLLTGTSLTVTNSVIFNGAGAASTAVSAQTHTEVFDVYSTKPASSRRSNSTV